MNKKDIRMVLEEVKAGGLSVDEALQKIKFLPFEDLGFAKVDHHRALRNGYPEVIYCEGKKEEHIVHIVQSILERDNNVLATRADISAYNAVKMVSEDAVYHDMARIITIQRKEMEKTTKKIAVVTGGTADIPVAEEAVVTCEALGNQVHRVYDVGVAGMHRLLANAHYFLEANVLIVVAGMEGALPSVVGGLVDKPVIAVPTSVGYGANFKGLSALLTMLNSCASGISVVNIDNGFGAGYMASMINKMNLDEERN